MRAKKIISAICYAVVFLVLILDAKTAIQGCSEGIQICLQTVIPSLFPFLIVCPLLTSRIAAFSTPLGKLISRLCGIPRGSESYFIIGVLGGYPIGAQILEQAYQNGILSRRDAGRMLGFCNNAGPAFILGMGASLFEDIATPFVLWSIQIASSILISLTLPTRSHDSCPTVSYQPTSAAKAITVSARNMGLICSWVIAFRILLSILARWVIWLLPRPIQILLTGILELSNGCVALHSISSETLRFILCTAFLSLGGLCVWMQTLSVTPGLNGGAFMIGRILHLVYGLALALLAQFFLFPENSIAIGWPVILLWALALGITLIWKKGIAFPGKMVYNKKKSLIEVDYAISQKDTT